MDYTSIKVGELPTGELSGSNFIPHEVAGLLKKATLTDLSAFIQANTIGFRAVSVSNGGTLPTTDTQEFILVGPGTYNNVGGGSTITVTEELNALVSNGTYWFVGVEISIDAPPGNAIWGQIIGTLSNQTDLKNILDLKADLVDGKVPAAQLPSYVDDVVEVASYEALPVIGEAGKIYITLNTGNIYRWSGSIYIRIANEAGAWGTITGTLSNQTDLQTALNNKQNSSADLSSIAGLTGTTGLLRKTAANTYSLDTNVYALDSGVVKLTGDQTITGNKTFTVPSLNSEAIIVSNSIGRGLRILNSSTATFGIMVDVENSSTAVPFYAAKGGLEVFKVDHLGNVTANSFIKSGGTSSQFLMADGSVSTSAVGSLEFNATDLTVWNNGKGNVSTNTSFGDKALKSNTSGGFNVAYGGNSLMNNTTGGANVSIGALSLQANTTGNHNVAVGLNALVDNTTGTNNVAIGSGALGTNTTGLNNAALGTQAGGFAGVVAVNNTTSSDSVFIGANTRPLAINQTNQIVIGHNAVGHGSNTVTLGNSSIVTTILRGSVGIGTTSPDASTVLTLRSSASRPANLYMQNRNATKSWQFGVDAVSVDDGSLVIQDATLSAPRLIINSTGNVTINTLGTGTVYSNAGTLTNTNPSDERLKENIDDLEYGLTEILQLRPVTYNWINDTANQGKQFGFIAQEVQEIMPDLINEFTITEDEEEVVRLGLDKEAIFVAMVNAIKELKAEIELLKK
jgi:hypothetical protein